MKLPRLREVRERHGWSQRRLSEEAGVSRDSISNYETGQRDAWPSTAGRLAEALGVEISDLMEVINHPKAQASLPPEDSERGDIDQQLIRQLEELEEKAKEVEDDAEIARRVGLVVDLVKQRVEQAKQRNRKRVTSE